ncbi:MAG: hypothetical protein AABX05_03050 [Nanoarchaeota archaeon]
MYHQQQYGSLEYIARNAAVYTPVGNTFYSIAAQRYDDGMFIPARDMPQYLSSEKRVVSYSIKPENYSLFAPKAEYHFIPDNFLKPGKAGIFVGKAEEVRPFIEEAFMQIFNQPFPNDIKISLLNEQEFRKMAPSANTIGLSINRGSEGLLSEIFVLNDSMGRVMLTIGHELGHVLTQTLSYSHDEEAKAYAFSLVWMKAIKENDIAGLADALVLENPAVNGLHDVSFSFVQRQIKQGLDEWQVYLDLINKNLSSSASLLR